VLDVLPTSPPSRQCQSTDGTQALTLTWPGIILYLSTTGLLMNGASDASTTWVCPSVRTYVRPRKVCLISMKFGVYIEVDE